MSSLFSSKYFEILKSLSDSELKSFDSWLNSPWCNSNKNLITLLDKVKKYYPNFENERLTKEKLFKQVLPKGKYSDRRMNNLLSEGYQAAERFIIFQNLAEDQKLQKDLLSQEFQSRHLEDWFFRDIQKEISRLEEKTVKDWEDHLDLLRLHRRVYHHPTQSTRMQPGGETIVKMGEELDLVYLLEKAVIINEKKSRSRIFREENYDIENEVKKWKIVRKKIEYSNLDYYQIRFSYTKENMQEQYTKLRATFLEYYEELSKKEQKIQLIALLNDSSLLFKQGKMNIAEILPLYKLGLKTGILLHNGQITTNTYTIIVSAANNGGDFIFANHFIENYYTTLKKEDQTTAYNWANAHMAYYQGSYQKSLDYLLKIDKVSNFFNLMVRFLTTQVYFDLYLTQDSYQTYLLNYLDAYEKWLSREKFKSEFTQKAYIRFVQKCRTLEKIYSDVNFQAEKLQNILEGEINLQGYHWILEKRDQILKLRSSKK